MFLWTLSVAYLQVRLGLKSAQAGSKQWVLEVWGHSCISMDWSLPLLCLCAFVATSTAGGSWQGPQLPH